MVGLPAAIGNVRMVTGGDAAIEAGIGVVNRAKESLSGEFFILNDPRACDALRDAWRGRNAWGNALIAAHPQSVEQAVRVAGPRTTVVRYGGLEPTTAPRFFIHTKSVARDMHTADPEAWLSTAAFGGNARREFELAGLFGGDAARAVHELVDSLGSKDGERQFASASWARAQGIYLTDPVMSDTSASDVNHWLIRNEPTKLTMGVKTLVDDRYASELARRHAGDGLPVDFHVERIDEPSERVLEAAGVDRLKPADDRPELHGNFLVAHGLGLMSWGSMWGAPRCLGRADVPNFYTGGGGVLPRAQWRDRSRELVAVTSDSRAIEQVLEGIGTLNARPHRFGPGEVVRR